MRIRSLVSICALASTLFASCLYAAPSVEITQSGFYPSTIEHGRLSSNSFTATFTGGDPTFEIPTDDITYSWEIVSVKVDSAYGTNYVVADEDDYEARLIYDECQNCDLDLRVWADGNWLIEVKVTVTYPDGYVKVINKEMMMPGVEARLAGHPHDMPLFCTTLNV